MHWWIYRRGLAVPAVMPRLDIDAAIGRGWHLELRRADFPRAWLLVPNPVAQKFLPTYPVSPGYLQRYRFVYDTLSGPGGRWWRQRREWP